MDRQQERLSEAGTANDGSRTTKGESQNEAQRLTCSLVIPKQRFTIGYWILRTMYKGGLQYR